MSFAVDSKTALVTGANRGIGRSILETLLARGASKVYAAVRDLDSVRPIVDVHGERVVPIELDLSKPETITAAANSARDVELLVNNAGVLKASSPLDAAALESLQFEMDINVYGLLRMAQAFAPVLKANGGGALVQLNSVASLRAFPAFATYAASKAAAYSITQALAQLLREQGTLVVSVHPGPIATDMAESAGLGDIAEPPSLVADAIIDALATGAFHVFPDSMAKQVGEAYAQFAEQVVEAELQAG